MQMTLREALDDLIREVGPTLKWSDRNRLLQLVRDERKGSLKDERIEYYLKLYGGGRYEIKKGETVVIVRENPDL